MDYEVTPEDKYKQIKECINRIVDAPENIIEKTLGEALIYCCQCGSYKGYRIDFWKEVMLIHIKEKIKNNV